MKSLTFRLWALWNFAALFVTCGFGNLPHRFVCREPYCEGVPYAHMSIPTALAVAWIVWSREIIHGPRLGYGYDHRLGA